MRALEIDIKRQTQAVFDEQVDSLPDKQGRMILAICSLVLASYRLLKQRLDDPSLAFDTVRLTFSFPPGEEWLIRFQVSGGQIERLKFERISWHEPMPEFVPAE